MVTELSNEVLDLIEQARSLSSRKALESDMRTYYRWLSANNREGIPSTPEAVAEYAAWLNLSGKKTSTIQRALSSISKVHKIREFENPCDSEIVRAVLRGIKRTNPSDKKKSKPLDPGQLIKCIQSQSQTSWPGARNRAILALTWGGALRISETAKMKFGDIEETDQGLVITISDSKTDQTGDGYTIGIPACWLVDEINFWINRLSQLYDSGPLFPRFRKSEVWFPPPGNREPLSVRGMSKIVTDIFNKLGLGRGYTTHSMRSGMITAAASAGVPERIIQEHSRHRSVMIMRGYIREASVFLDNPLLPILQALPSPRQDS